MNKLMKEDSGMKMKRLAALVCVVLLAVGMVSIGSAERAVLPLESKSIEFEFYSSTYLVKNGETAKLLLTARSTGLYSMDGSYSYSDIDFDCEGTVKGKVISGSDWVKVYNRGDIKIRIAENKTTKKRTAEIRVTGDHYSATLVFTQWGRTRIISAIRNKKTVTLKFQKAEGPKKNYLSIRRYDSDGNGNYNWDSGEYIYDNGHSGKSYKLKVQKGCYYDIYYGPAIWIYDNWAYGPYETCCSFSVYSTSGKEDYSSYIYDCY